MNRKHFVTFIGLTAITFLIGCSPSEKSLVEAQKRIDALKTKGVPDSSLSEAKVLLYQVRDAKFRGDKALARTSAKSMNKVLAQAEVNFTASVTHLTPAIDSMKSLIRIAREGLSGIQKQKLDSMNAVIDSFMTLGWVLEAHAKAQETMVQLPQLKFNDDRAKELAPRIPGEWVCINKSTHAGDPTVNGIEKKVFTFNRDGSCKFVEIRKGKTGQSLKEDAEFVSTGTYDFNGDTIVLKINRFSAVRQNFERLFITGGKKEWRKENHPTYDSLMTDGSQDRYIAFSDLDEDFEQTKKF